MSRLAACALAVLLLCPAARAGDATTAITRLVDGLHSEEAECGLLVGLCRAAANSLRRADQIPGGAEIAGTRQSETAAMRVDEAVTAADAIARKHGGRRLRCFRDPECRGILPAPAAPPKRDDK